MAILGFNPSASVVNPDEYKNRFQNPWGVPQALKISPFDKATDPNLGQLAGATALDKLDGILATPMFGGQNFSQEAESLALRPMPASTASATATNTFQSSKERYYARQSDRDLLSRRGGNPDDRISAQRFLRQAPVTESNRNSTASASIRDQFGFGSNPSANSASIASDRSDSVRRGFGWNTPLALGHPESSVPAAQPAALPPTSAPNGPTVEGVGTSGVIVRGDGGFGNGRPMLYSNYGTGSAGYASPDKEQRRRLASGKLF